jgi:dinuclear metal center YbgI/SA1388 family protein
MTTIHHILQTLEQVAPLSYQESYDNSGLIVGDRTKKVKNTLLTLDCTEEVVDEAIAKNCQLIIAHHPILFTGLKSITGKNYIERVLLKAIKKDIAIYAAHTNLDNIETGVNKKIAEKIGLQHCKVLAPTSNILNLLYVYVPIEFLEKVRNSLFAAGAGHIGEYEHCSFNIQGEGTFKALERANPFVGEVGKVHIENEVKLEVIVPNHLLIKVLDSMRTTHPYEEIAYGVIELKNENQTIGAGMIGKLKKPMSEIAFLKMLKTTMKTKSIRHTRLRNKPIERVALCGGSGSFLLKNALMQGADAFITADFKYHQFFDAENILLITDIGHFESEQFTPEIFYEILSKKFPNFAFHLSSVNTNPVHYY